MNGFCKFSSGHNFYRAMHCLYLACSITVESPAYRKYIPVHIELFATRVRSGLLKLTFDLSCLGYKMSPRLNRKQVEIPHGVMNFHGWGITLNVTG